MAIHGHLFFAHVADQADVVGLGQISDSDSGSDPAYGAGLRFSLGSMEIRGEYELFDIDGSDDVYLLSAGLVWTF